MSIKHPVKKVFITQAWGVNPQNYAKFGLLGHNGIDYRAFLSNGDKCFEEGRSEVFAPHDGEVLENFFDADGYGNYVKIENSDEGSILAHLSPKPGLAIGTKVKQGDFVGYQGSTGNSSGLHLHWGYYPKPRNKANGYSGTIDQLPLIREQSDVVILPIEITKDTIIDFDGLTAGPMSEGFEVYGKLKVQEVEAKLVAKDRDIKALQRDIFTAREEIVRLNKELTQTPPDQLETLPALPIDNVVPISDASFLARFGAWLSGLFGKPGDDGNK